MKLRRPNGSFPWSVDEDDQLRSILERGDGCAAVARKLGRTEEAVRQRAFKLRLSAAKKPLTVDTVQR